MKVFNKYFLALLTGGLMFVSCSDEIEREPSPVVDPDCLGAYFVPGEGFDATNNSYYYELEPENETKVTLMVGREKTDAAATVPLVVITNTEDVFEIPASVEFAAGQKEAPVIISFPNAEIGQPYQFEIKFAEGDYDPYAKLSYVSGEVLRIQWIPCETTLLMDGLVPTFFNAPYPVAHYVDAKYAVLPGGAKRVRLQNPYAPATAQDENGITYGYPNNADGDMTGRDVLMQIDIQGEDASMGRTMLGFDWGYGEFFCGNVYPELKDDVKSYPLGVVTEDKEGNLVSIVFGANSLYVGMMDYNGGGAYPASNPTGIFFSLEAYNNYLKELE
jgi:hypothetical protein